VLREGYESFEDFKAAWIRINGSWDPEIKVYVVSFELVIIYNQVSLVNTMGARRVTNSPTFRSGMK